MNNFHKKIDDLYDIDEDKKITRYVWPVWVELSLELDRTVWGEEEAYYQKYVKNYNGTTGK